MSIGKFDAALKATIDNEVVQTENGANAFRTSGKSLLDLNFSVSTLRNEPKEEIEKMFARAFFEDKLLAVKWLFFARDIRGNGMGERRLFRVCFSWMANIDPALCKRLIPLVAEYGRFDDVLCCGLEGDLWKAAVDYVAKTLSDDMKSLEEKKPVSLLAKWLPSTNASSPKTKALARKVRTSLGMDEKTYRKVLSSLRAYLKVVEVDMSKKNWAGIDYNMVPSMANLKYKDAFLKNDPIRRSEWLSSLLKLDNGSKINASAAFPCDIVYKYAASISAVDTTLEAMWKALPDYVAGNENGSTLCVVDGSGSMLTNVGSTHMTALEVAKSLGIYFSERLTGEFRDKFITFSSRPQYVDLSGCKTLRDKVELSYQYDECSNTDLMATFDLILETAVRHGLKQEDMPANVLFASDMNFDKGTYSSSGRYDANDCSLFKEISDKFEANGYKMPRCIWWNIIGGEGRKAHLPVNASQSGVVLVSGFSPAVAKMVFSAKTNPWDVLVEALSTKRYDAVEKAFKEVA